MKTTNNFATETRKQTFEDKLDAFANKVENRINDFTKRMSSIVANAYKIMRPVWKSFETACHSVVRGCVAIIHDSINFAVKLSIILIAVIMLYNFAQANPELAVQINESTVNFFNVVRDAAIQAYDKTVNALMMPFKLFGLFQ
jgi:hypothetical protein